MITLNLPSISTPVNKRWTSKGAMAVQGDRFPEERWISTCQTHVKSLIIELNAEESVE